MKVEKLLATTSIANEQPRDAVHILGALVNDAMDRNNAASARHAITLASDLPLDTWPPTIRAYAYYTLANAHDELRRHETKTPGHAWSWTADFDASLLRLRQAANDEGFTALPKQHQCQILTNLANNLNTIGRTIQALHHWNHALTIDPTFSMARANRAQGLLTYARALYDKGHTATFIWLAYHDLNDSIPTIPYDDAKQAFTALRDDIKRFPNAEKLNERPTFDVFPLGETPEEIAYRTWTLKHRLFLNPLNDVTTESIAANDILHCPDMIAPIGEPPILQGFYNQLKQEYTTARFLLYQGIMGLAPTFPDTDVQLVNTLDYPAYGTNLELVKLAYRSCYSLFDKIAYFLNDYLNLRIPPTKVYFQTLWFEKQDPKHGLKPCFANRANLPLRGLYWLSRDLNKTEDRQLASDAARLATIRDHLEHKYLKAHTEHVPERSDTLAYTIDRHTLEAKAQHLLTIAREALTNLSLALHIDEETRKEKRGDHRIVGIPLTTYEDKWKR